MSSLPPPPPRPPVPSELEAIGPVEADPRRWGLGDVWLGLLISVVASGISVSLAVELGGYDDFDSVPMWLFSVSQAPLPLSLAGLAIWAASAKGRGVVPDLRFSFTPGDAGKGLITGVLAQLVLVPAVTFPIIWLTDTDTDKVSESARELADRANTATGVVALVITTVILAPFAEELFFRGLVLESYKKRRNFPWVHGAFGQRRPDTLGRKWNLGVAMVLSSAIFALVHFNPLLFPALFAVGLVFARLAQRSGRLGPSICAHAAFNATTVLSLLAFEGDDEALFALVALLPG